MLSPSRYRHRPAAGRILTSYVFGGFEVYHPTLANLTVFHLVVLLLREFFIVVAFHTIRLISPAVAFEIFKGRLLCRAHLYQFKQANRPNKNRLSILAFLCVMSIIPVKLLRKKYSKITLFRQLTFQFFDNHDYLHIGSR